MCPRVLCDLLGGLEIPGVFRREADDALHVARGEDAEGLAGACLREEHELVVRARGERRGRGLEGDGACHGTR